MNIKLLRRVQKHIQEDPRRLDMDRYAYQAPPSLVQSCPHHYPPSGIQACIAGWALLLSRRKVPILHGAGTFQRARKLLGLNSDEADRLFLKWEWPNRFPYKSDAVGRIEHFIRTNGRE